MAKVTFDDSLPTWEDAGKGTDWAGLLIGNGASRSVWDKFKYASLFDAARSNEVEHPLITADLDLFERLDTVNFERVLAALATARMVGRALGTDVTLIEARYASIQRALVEAVKQKHLPWNSFPPASMTKIRAALLEYQWVYTTNYDLLVYWARMHDDPDEFKDYFWSERFDLADTEIWGKATRVLYLHGGLHLYRTPLGATLKRRAEFGTNLLDLFGTPMEEDAVPLFVAEGEAKDKLATIYRSDYLSFAYQTLLGHEGPLAVFGQGFGDSDKHIVDAINHCRTNLIAVSLLPTDDIIEQKKRLHSLFPHATVNVYNAKTHPLGADDLLVPAA